MSKLGLHIHAWNNRILDYCKNVGGAVHFVLDPNEMMINEAKAAQPKSLFIFRLWVPEQKLDNPIKNAQEFTDLLLLYMDGCRLDGASGYNEWDGDLQYGQGGPSGLENWKRYADFEAERSRILHREGYLSVVGGCSVGTPPEEWFSHFKPALEEGDFLHLHEYSAPRMWDHVNWHCLKYRFVYDYLKEHGLPTPPLIVSESGIDGGVCGRPKEGWRSFVNAKQYMEDWRWYDSHLMEDAYVVGCCAFDCGPLPGMGWQSFKIDPEMLDEWAPYVKARGVSYWEGGEEVETPLGWEKVPERIRRWYPLLFKHAQRIWPYQMIPYKDKKLHPDRIMACIIERESTGNPDAVNPESGAAGLCQIMPFHFEGTINPLNPDWNIGKGMNILKTSLDNAMGDLQRALFYYSGKADRPFEPFVEGYWKFFVDHYKEWFGIDIDPDNPIYTQKVLESLARIESHLNGAEYLCQQGKEETKAIREIIEEELLDED